MAKLGDVWLAGSACQFSLQIVDVEIVSRRSGCGLAGIQQALMVEGRQQGATVLKRAQPIKPHRVEPLEDVAIFAMPGSTAMLLDEPLDLLEACDDPLLAGGAPDRLRGLREVGEFVAQRVEVEVTHSDPRP